MRTVLAAAAIALFAAAPAAHAQGLSEAEAEAVFMDYQRAIAAAEACYDVTFDQAQHRAMMAVINEAVEHKIGTKRLRLVTQAENDVSGMLPSQSCKGAKIQDMLALFERDLRPALGG